MKKHGGKSGEDIARKREQTTSTSSAQGRKKSRGKKILRIVVATFGVLVIAFGLVALGGYVSFTQWAKKAEFDAALLPTATAIPTVLDRYGDEIPYAADGYVDPDSVPQTVKNAFVALEDRRFYSHKGYDVKGILRAVATNLKAGKTVEGASTITQQLVKNTHLSSERTLKRKLKEIAIAMKIEENYTKDEILAMYLSVIYFGAGAYGINDASRTYFGCTPQELTTAQAATLAGILKNPSRYSPKNNIERATERRNLVLDVMYSEGYITAEERDRAKAEKMVLADKKETPDFTSQYVEAAVREACNLLGITEYRLQNSGLVIMTALDPERQRILARETSDRANYSADGVDGAALLLDNDTGEISAYFGTTGYEITRQGGSVMKPIAVYAPALDTGAITLATPLRDEKTDFGGYSPDNFGGIYYGDTTPREAIKKSMNTAAVKVLTYVGTERALGYCRKLGLPVSDGDDNLAFALGATTQGLNPKMLAGAYSALAREGNYIKPHFVRAIVQDGKKIRTADVSAEQVFSPETAALITDCLRDTVKSGTARSLSTLPFAVAGKTGTVQKDSEYNTDAWSLSFTAEHTLAVWHGADKMTELGGGHPTRHAANIWRQVYENEKPADFVLPRGVVSEEVDLYSTFRNKKATLALPSTPSEYRRTELFNVKYRADESASRFALPTPDFILSTEGQTVKLELNAEPAFDYTVLCTDATGTKIVAVYSQNEGLLRYDASLSYTLSPSKKDDGSTELYPDTVVTIKHKPFSMGGKVTYTLQMSVAGGDGTVTGTQSKDCFPESGGFDFYDDFIFKNRMPKLRQHSSAASNAA